MAKTKNVTVITGKYMKDGQEKSRYMDIGAIIETKNGPMLKIEAVPLGWDGWAYLNDPKPREPQAETYSGGLRQPAGKPADFDDDLPSF